MNEAGMTDLFLTPDVQVKTVSQAELEAHEENADDDTYFEVIDGEIIEEERAMSWEHFDLIRLLYLFLHGYVEAHQLGTVYPDGVRYILQGSSSAIQRARRPDLSFLRAGRLTPDFDPRGDFVGAPDLAVEVISGQDSGTAGQHHRGVYGIV
jgi:Uma2 family endonuclease